MISYAQNYEDVMLARALANVAHGFYVDVGAQHPVNGSVTKVFYARGWRGINIEPVERWFRLVCDDRPDDVNLRCPISDERGTVELFDVEDTGLSTIRPDYAAEAAGAGWNVVKRMLKTHTLNAVFRSYAPADVHFLKVDVEGAEAAVLRSLDLKRFRPWIILVEATKPNSPEPSYADWEPLLLNAEYGFVYDDGLNRFYIAQEHAELAVHFQRPPNFFDGFMPYSEWWARQQMDSLRYEIDQERSRNQAISSSIAESLPPIILQLSILLDAAVEARSKESEAIKEHTFPSVSSASTGLLDQLARMQSRLNERCIDQATDRLSARIDALSILVDKNALAVHEQLEELKAWRRDEPRFDAAMLVREVSNRVVTSIDPMVQRVSSVEKALHLVHARLEFANNVQIAYLHSAERARLAEEQLQQILHSRSWRAMGVPRLVARLLRGVAKPDAGASLKLRSQTRGSGVSAVFNRAIIFAARNRVARCIGAFVLRRSPALKAHMVRVVLGHTPYEMPQPKDSAHSDQGGGANADLPSRAAQVRSMLDQSSARG